MVYASWPAVSIWANCLHTKVCWPQSHYLLLDLTTVLVTSETKKDASLPLKDLLADPRRDHRHVHLEFSVLGPGAPKWAILATKFLHHTTAWAACLDIGLICGQIIKNQVHIWSRI